MSIIFKQINNQTLNKRLVLCYINGISKVKLLNYDHSLRRIQKNKIQNIDVLQQMMNNNNVPPNLLQIVNDSVMFKLGLIGGSCSHNQLGLLNVLESNIQSQIDESLIEMEENQIHEKQFRKILCEMRDNDYDLMMELRNQHQISDDQNQLDFIVKVLLRVIRKY